MGLPSEIPLCTKCGMKHIGKCLSGIDNCFGCEKTGHNVRDFPMSKTQGMESNQTQISSPNFDVHTKNRFYALCSRVIKRILPMFLTVCCKYSPLVFMHW